MPRPAVLATLLAGCALLESAMAQTPTRSNLFYAPPVEPIVAPPLPETAERAAEVRAENPDLGRVLKLDATAEQRLIELLARHAPPMAPYGNETAALCTQQIGEIAALLAAPRLESYLDYRATLRQRREVEQFQASLPLHLQLTAAQKDDMTAVLHSLHDRRELQLLDTHIASARLSVFSEPGLTPQERVRRKQVANVGMLDEMAARTEALDRQLFASLTPLLNAAQLQSFASQQRGIDLLRALAGKFRKELALTAVENVESPIPQLDAKISLRLELRVDDERVVETLISERGGAVAFRGPADLTFDVQPYLIDVDEMRVRINVYESGREQPRLLVRTSSLVWITTPRPRAQEAGPHEMKTGLCGRRGYTIEWSARATYQ